MTELQVTSGAEWRKENSEGVPLLLPSGKVARVRSINVALLLKLGRIPDQMTQQVIDAVFNGQELEFDIKSAEKMTTFLKLLDGICETCFVFPRIVKAAQSDDEITVDDVEMRDKMFLFQLLNRPVAELARFRQEQESDVASLDDFTGHEAETE